MNTNKRVILSWVDGNDKNVAVWLYENVPNETERQPFDFTTCDKIEVSIVSNFAKRYVVSYSAIEGEVNGLLLTIPHTTPAGFYNIDIKVIKTGTHLRSYEGRALRIVNENQQSKTTFERVTDNHNADYEIDMQIVPSALVRPLNIYEMWKMFPGNEDKTFNDFMEVYLVSITEDAIRPLLAGKVDKVVGKGLSTFDFDEYWRGTITSLMSAVQELGTAMRDIDVEVNGEFYY